MTNTRVECGCNAFLTDFLSLRTAADRNRPEKRLRNALMQPSTERVDNDVVFNWTEGRDQER